MGEFLEFTDYKGEKVLVNINHIIKVEPRDEGVCLYFDISTESGSSSSLYCECVAERYAIVKKKLQQ